MAVTVRKAIRYHDRLVCAPYLRRFPGTVGVNVGRYIPERPTARRGSTRALAKHRSVRVPRRRVLASRFVFDGAWVLPISEVYLDFSGAEWRPGRRVVRRPVRRRS